jgi:nucleoid-associated protein YgaU
VLDGLDITYQLFARSGVPLRAKLNITLKEYRPAAVQIWQEQRSSADVEKSYLVRLGDTLPGIAAQVYKDPARWRELAVANSIRDPRDLRPGRRLVLPRLQ